MGYRGACYGIWVYYCECDLKWVVCAYNPFNVGSSINFWSVIVVIVVMYGFSTQAAILW